MTDNKFFRWAAFFSGMVNPLNLAKAFVLMLHMAVIVLVISSTVFSVLWLKRKFAGKKPPVQTVSIANQTGGTVHNSNDQVTKKFGLLNFL